MEHGDLAQELRSAFSRKTDFYRERGRPARGRYSKVSGFEKEVKDSMKKIMPKEEDIGAAILADSDKIIKKLTDLEEEWIEKIGEFEFGIDEAWDRVMQGAKEDVAMARHEEAVAELVDQGVDPDEAEDEAEEVDPDDIDEEDVWEHYSHEDMWQWWNQEWHHNIVGRPDKKGNEMYPLAKYVDESDFDFQKFRQYESHIPSVFMSIVRDFEQEAQNVIYEVKEAIIDTKNDLMAKRKQLFDAIFENKDFNLRT